MALIALVWRRSFWDLHASVLGLLLSVSLTTVFTQVVKVRLSPSLALEKGGGKLRKRPPATTRSASDDRART